MYWYDSGCCRCELPYVMIATQLHSLVQRRKRHGNAIARFITVVVLPQVSSDQADL